MLIDWFTIVAQIINFLVLVYLLKRFLYGPIVTAMNNRELRVMAQLRDAKQQQAEADQAGSAYRQQQQAFEQQRDQLLADAQRLADERHQALVRAARDEVTTLKSKWRESIRHDEAIFLQQLRHRAAEQIVNVARQALHELADAELEQQIVTIFLRRLQNLSLDERALLQQTMAQIGQTAVVRSAFSVSSVQRQQIGAALAILSGSNPALAFEAAPDLICGISLVVGGHEIAWSVQSYLEAFDVQIAQALADVTNAADDVQTAMAGARVPLVQQSRVTTHANN